MTSKRIHSLEAEARQARKNLASRWDALELEVAGLANTAKEEVTQTVQQAKETISVTHQVRKRPWAMIAGSIVTGIMLSRFRGIRSLAVLSLATPIVKNALESDSVARVFRPLSHGLNRFSENSEPDSFIDVLRIKAVNSLADMAKELIKRNVPRSLVPVLEQAITNSAQSFAGTGQQIPQPRSFKATHGIDEEFDGPSIH